jgi:hypothetical protein
MLKMGAGGEKHKGRSYCVDGYICEKVVNEME